MSDVRRHPMSEELDDPSTWVRLDLEQYAQRAADALDALYAENERLASVRDRLHHELTELIALFGTNELRKYHAYAGCIEALAMSVESGSKAGEGESITLKRRSTLVNGEFVPKWEPFTQLEARVSIAEAAIKALEAKGAS